MADGKSAPLVGELVAGSYQVLGTAGVGGMGVVYRALDVKLGRNVALKFLPADLNSSEREKERFLKEARTASSLDHPNIGVIHAIEDTDDERSFIVMAFYEGKSLAQRIRSGPLPPAEAVDIAIQMLKGLEYAHSRGIEHRDIKPSNIMLTQQDISHTGTLPEASIKIVDFGLAHVSQQTASATHGISGTVAYMSPEQTLGKPIDARSDIWAAGIVLFEMLAGHDPFHRETIPATVFAILNDPPKPPEATPIELQQVIYRALSKDSTRRYQSCGEMLRDLEIVRPSLHGVAAGAGAGPHSVHNTIKRGKETIDLRRSREYASLSAWSPPASKWNWKPWAIVAGAIVLLFAGGLLIPPVRAKFTGLLPVAETESHRPKQAAYEGYLAALSYMDRYDKPGNIDRAITALQGSLKADPLFALAYAQMGEAYRMKYQTDQNPKWLELALANCQKAEELDDRIPAVYSTLAQVHNNQGKHDLALQEYQQALEINPRDPAALRGVARFNEIAGHLPEAEGGIKKAAALRPDDWSGYNELADFYVRNGRFKDAIDAYKHAAALSPDNANVWSNLGSAYLDSGDARMLPDAEQALTKSLAIKPSYFAYSNLAVLYMQQKRYAESAAMSSKALAIDDHDYLTWENLRTAYEWLHNRAEADETARKEVSLLEQHVKANSQDGLGQAILSTLYAKLGQTANAELRIQTALALAPNDPQVLQSIADSYEVLGDQHQAKAYLDAAVKKGATPDSLATDIDLQSLLGSTRAALVAK